MGRNRSAKERLGLETENITGANIRLFRKSKFGHLSDREFCLLLSESTGLVLNKTTLSRIETGKRVVLDYEIERIARLLNVGIEDLFIHRK